MTAHVFIENLAARVQTPDKGVATAQIVSESDLAVSVLALAAGHELKEHTTPWPLLLQVLEGEGTITAGGENHQVSAGAWLGLPAAMPHAVSAKTPLKLLLTLLKAAPAGAMPSP